MSILHGLFSSGAELLKNTKKETKNRLVFGRRGELVERDTHSQEAQEQKGKTG